MLHLGNNVTIALRDIVLILPTFDEAGVKARIYLADGRVIASAVAASTLNRRISGGMRPPAR